MLTLQIDIRQQSNQGRSVCGLLRPAWFLGIVWVNVNFLGGVSGCLDQNLGMCLKVAPLVAGHGPLDSAVARAHSNTQTVLFITDIYAII